MSLNNFFAKSLLLIERDSGVSISGHRVSPNGHSEITESKVGEPLYHLEAFLDVFGFVYILIR